MKTAFTFRRWYWATPTDKQPPQWWSNFLLGKDINIALKELSTIAKVREKPSGKIRVVFNDPNELAFFIMRWS
jgi:hypothetical protein